MKFCQPHWDKLRAAIEARGLSHLVAKDAQTAMADTVAQLEGTATEANYDPLMNAHWMITGRALQMGGLYLMMADHCPVCEVMKHMAHIPRTPEETEPAGAAWVESHWIDGPADAVLTYCQERGLVPPKQ